jgi:hypothetical protein
MADHLVPLSRLIFPDRGKMTRAVWFHDEHAISCYNFSYHTCLKLVFRILRHTLLCLRVSYHTFTSY